QRIQAFAKASFFSSSGQFFQGGFLSTPLAPHDAKVSDRFQFEQFRIEQLGYENLIWMALESQYKAAKYYACRRTKSRAVVPNWELLPQILCQDCCAPVATVLFALPPVQPQFHVAAHRPHSFIAWRAFFPPARVLVVLHFLF